MSDGTMSGGAMADSPGAERYLELIKRCLTRELFADSSRVLAGPSLLQRLTRNRLGGGSHRVEVGGFDSSLRAEGRDWPSEAETMIGRARLDNLEHCVSDVVKRGVPGDLIETGVWRGGATILMRAVLAAYGDTTRTVWVADSFQGLPKPDVEQYPQDAGDEHWTMSDDLAIPLEAVQAHVAKYGRRDDQVQVLVGWFSDTLPTAPIERLAVVRLDGDMYESTMDGLRNLYPKLSVGGYLIVDDYGAVPACREAVEDFRVEQGITDAVHQIDWTGVFWQRAS
ncbi:MAG: TylF/MycF family methyltransferase [Microthrixaceae bacterium]